MISNAKLKEQFTNIIECHSGRELWSTRPDMSYDECLEPLLDDFVKVAKRHKQGRDHRPYDGYSRTETYAPSINGEYIGEKILALRVKKGWSLAQLAGKAGLDEDYIRNVERGEDILRIHELERILENLKVKSSAVLPF
jgi:ribosome-binding protein aMBF1 (putative translation factor)